LDGERGIGADEGNPAWRRTEFEAEAVVRTSEADGRRVKVEANAQNGQHLARPHHVAAVPLALKTLDIKKIISNLRRSESYSIEEN